MKFTFQRLDGTPAPDHERPARFGFECPRRKGTMCDGLLLRRSKFTDPDAPNIPKKTWEWNGSRDRPTFHPSINCRTHAETGEKAAGCGWHGHITAGAASECS